MHNSANVCLILPFFSWSHDVVQHPIITIPVVRNGLVCQNVFLIGHGALLDLFEAIPCDACPRQTQSSMCTASRREANFELALTCRLATVRISQATRKNTQTYIETKTKTTTKTQAKDKRHRQHITIQRQLQNTTSIAICSMCLASSRYLSACSCSSTRMCINRFVNHGLYIYCRSDKIHVALE